MKLQGVAVVFALIVLPTIMILSLYLSYNIDTIALQTSYDTKLLDATYDAVSAIEINTANEDLSSVADSLRTIIDASANTFVTSISSSLGLSSSSNYQIEPYIPALLYTLYDGFYIYTPTNVPKIVKDDNGMPNRVTTPGSDDYGKLKYYTTTGGESTTIDGDTAYSKDYLLKPFMQYAATYINGDKKLTVNYTQDNYITINGIDEQGITYSKSGYLVDTGSIRFETYLGEAGGNFEAFEENADNDADDIFKVFGASSEEEIEREIDKYRKTKTITKNGKEITYTLSDCDESKIKCKITKNIEVSNGVYEKYEETINDAEAIKYYAKAYVFSDWLYDTFGEFEEMHFESPGLKGITYETSPNDSEETTTYEYLDFTTSSRKLFQRYVKKLDKNGNEVRLSISDSSSVFSEHKKEIMQALILYNLNTAISTYNAKTPTQKSFQLPLLEGNEWDLILNNITMVAYLQNLPCGLKFYNNYAVVPSTNNEFMVTESTMVYMASDLEEDKIDKSIAGNAFVGLNNGTTEYHTYDCPYLYTVDLPAGGSEIQGYREFDFIYDRRLNESGSEYLYDHQNLACYYCMVNKNYKNDDALTNTNFKSGVRARLTAIARERQNIYKSIGMTENYGYLFKDAGGTGYNLQELEISVPNNEDVKNIVITVSSTSTNPPDVPIGTAVLTDGSNKLDYLPAKASATSDGSVLALNLNSSTTQTIEFNDIKNCPSKVELDVITASGNQPEIKKKEGSLKMEITIKIVYR